MNGNMDGKWDPENLPDGTIAGNGYSTILAWVEDGREFQDIVDYLVPDQLDFLDEMIRDGSGDGLPSQDLDELRSWVLAIVEAEYARHAAAAAPDPEDTEAHRLSQAFRELELAGIIAREHVDGTGREANSFLVGLLRRTREARGFACYTREDAQHPRAVLVGYGAREEGGEAPAAIGREVAEVLRSHGFTVTWDGNPNTRLDLAADARRPRRGRHAAFAGRLAESQPAVEWDTEAMGDRAQIYRIPRWVRAVPSPATPKQLAALLLPWLPDGVAVAAPDCGAGTAGVARLGRCGVRRPGRCGDQ